VAPGFVPFVGTPTTNLSNRFGVPLLPSHKAQPEGIEAKVPDHIQITPVGIAEDGSKLTASGRLEEFPLHT
jgi:hypothetical protein